MLWNLPADSQNNRHGSEPGPDGLLCEVRQVDGLTVERVAQVDLVPERVAQLDPDELPVPGPLHVLFTVTVRVRVRLKGELSPDGVFTCTEY